MNEWPAAVWASISAMTAALVLSFVVVLGSLARESASIQQEDDNAVAIVKEHRRYSQFDGTTNLYPQDVISAIAESRGMPEIWVDTTAGTNVNFNWKWVSTTPASQFSTTYLTDPNLFPITARYDSTLVKDLNGAITHIEFRRQ
ncbi:hypothetical protein QFZ81_000138 [Paenibacillus sp. V4I9]|uniref:hypothetical protein n=1 Tax=Paenibacillus sp. V4I9 TaxID=3042308 RepID=UPI00278864AC|nr:hypothetical protein [Paenibacillus sp. V4I9]MDQ0885050.1 hypothetical protein [Paenibacillus sp. V4I9]